MDRFESKTNTKMNKLTKFLTGSWIILGLMAVFPGVVNASGNLTIVVKNPNPYTNNQSWFTYEKKPGEVIEDVAEVKNLSDSTIKAHVYPVDATSNDSGSFILKLENESRDGIGKWTTMNSQDIITIAPHQNIDFPFQIKVPENITPGQYFGGLVLEEIGDSPQVIQTAAASTATGKTICCTNILVKTRIGLRIYLTIPGTIKDSMEWSDFNILQKNTQTNFQFEIKNTGNVGLEPIATIKIYDNSGNQIDEVQKTLGESLPGTTINPVIIWDKQPLFGSFKAVGQVTYHIKSQTVDTQLHGSAENNTKTTNFSIIPWKMLIIILLCILAAGIGFIIYFRNQQQIKSGWELYEIQPNDNIMSVAQAHNVDWKKLANVNKLKPPYLIRSGEKLRVPKNTKHQQKQPSLFDDNKHA